MPVRPDSGGPSRDPGHLGSPETVARKLATTIQTLGIQRFDLKYSAGTLPHAQLLRSIEIYGSKVVPMVKDLLA